MRIIYGTNNPSKLESMKKKLGGLGIQLDDLSSLNMKLKEPEEIGDKPSENAKIKALSYYKQIKLPILSHDCGLYFENVADEDQLGVFVKRLNGMNLDYNELIGFYSEIAKKYGGKVVAYYKNAYCLVVNEESVNILSEPVVNTDKFFMVDEPHKSYREGFPLDSLSVDIKTGKYYYDLDEYDNDEDEFNSAVKNFVSEIVKRV